MKTQIVLALILIFGGRLLFWVFVGVMGFVYGYQVAALLFDPNEVPILLIAAACGALGAVLSVFLQKPAAACAGFLAGGYGAMTAVLGPQWANDPGWWGPFLIGGIAGFFLVLFFFDWALIFLSSFSGASLLAQNLNLTDAQRPLMTVGFLAVGMFAQGALLLKSKNSPAKPS